MSMAALAPAAVDARDERSTRPASDDRSARRDLVRLLTGELNPTSPRERYHALTRGVRVITELRDTDRLSADDANRLLTALLSSFAQAEFQDVTRQLFIGNHRASTSARLFRWLRNALR